jgi:hypothetical protein
MTKGISLQGFVPVRQEPNHTSGMVSQILFGETITILETRGFWAFVKLDFDGTEGWAASGSIQHLEEGPGPGDKFRMVVYPSVTVTDLDHGRPLLLPAGAIRCVSTGTTFSAGGRNFGLLSEDGWMDSGVGKDPEKTGRLLLSVPGLYGGRCGFGCDAPGLMQLLYRTMGISLPRSCASQAEAGSPLSFIHEVEKGDLAFFDNEKGEINHVGMVLGQGKIIHAYDQVRIDTLDHQGIFNAETKGYTHRLRVIKRPI